MAGSSLPRDSIAMNRTWARVCVSYIYTPKGVATASSWVDGSHSTCQTAPLPHSPSNFRRAAFSGEMAGRAGMEGRVGDRVGIEVGVRVGAGVGVKVGASVGDGGIVAVAVAVAVGGNWMAASVVGAPDVAVGVVVAGAHPASMSTLIADRSKFPMMFFTKFPLPV
jgi:hypothetical protein